MRKAAKGFILLTLCVIHLSVFAQYPPISQIEINNVKANVLGDGTSYYPGDENASCPIWEVPQGGGVGTVFQHALWLGGMKGDSLHLAAMRLGQGGRDYWSGPLRTVDATTELMSSLRYSHVWKLTRNEINQFIANHGNADYQVPEDILTWPAHGHAGFADNLAPFVDVNGDGHYNPADGDYPEIRGDQCLFFIFNDGFGSHSESGGAKIGLEVHAMVYGFEALNDEALNNTIFVNFKLFNRSANDYHDTYLGLWNDWAIGFGNDDYVGCDVRRNACFAYNGDLTDGIGGAGTYGNNPPVQVLTVLNGPDGLGMTGFICHNNDNAINGDPENANEYYRLLRGLWKDGTLLQYGGNGCFGDSGTVGPACHFMFPGDSDPDNIGTDGVVPNGGYNANGVYWTEENEGNVPGNRNGLLSIGPFDFPAGGMKELDYAMITVWKEGAHSAMERKSVFIDHVKAFFDGYVDKKIKFVKDGTNLMVRSHLSEENDILVKMFQYRGNTTFKSLYVGDKHLSDEELASDPNLIRVISDMVGPVGVSSFWALYAQHGWCIPRMSVIPQPLDNSDIGSIWVDQDNHRFSIGMVDDTSIYLLPEVILEQNGVYSASWNNNLKYPSTLTHVSGATHTGSIVGSSSRFDLVIQQVSDRQFILDGVDVFDDGVYFCNQLRIQEHILGCNIGEVETWFPIPEYKGSMIDFDRTFVFDNGMNVTCNTILYCRHPFLITGYRGVQPQFPVLKDQYHSYSFIPKVKTTASGHRVDIPFNSDEGTFPRINVNRTEEHLYNVDKQPERCVSYLQDDDGSFLLGMAGGCSLTRGLSVDSIRNVNIHIGNNTVYYGGRASVANKFYPKLIETESFAGPVDSTFVAEMSGYFSWFDPSINDCVVYYYKDEDNYIVYIHAFESVNKAEINLPKFMEGMVVDSVIEKTTGASLLTEQVIGGKMYASFATEDNIANYIVVKMRSTWNERQ